MLLSGYTKKIFRPECNPGFESVHCIARLNENVSRVLPYLNAELGASQYFVDPPEVMFHHHGKIIKVGAREIAINALKDEHEAETLLNWLTSEINRVWANRSAIAPCYTGKTRPQLMQILLLLPKTNCKKCGRPTCMAFAAQVMEGGRGPDDCPELNEDKRRKLSDYLEEFTFE